MIRTTLTLSLASAISAFALQASAQATVTVDGSSTVFPISEAYAEEFQKQSGTRVTVGLSGTGGGFKKFCRGETDVTGASRPIRTVEMDLCKENKIEFIELPVAMDGLAVVVSPKNNFAECMSVAELKTMWDVPAQGVVNNWNQANPKFPDAPLRLFGAGTDSGTYDYFTFAINGKEHESRGDFTATEDDNITVNGVAGDEFALGFLGLAYLEENRDKLKPVSIRMDDNSPCVEPTV
ncbi:MAG: PstS family phosphate ABC transporter substrate-binding protein, partial [Hyphomonas sp.]